MKAVSVFMDVEDPINPLADLASIEFAEIFTSVGVRGSLCLTGEKCRKLLVRHGPEVAKVFGPHCLGLHTDTHSYHPTTMELLEDLDFEEGRTAAYKAEKPGFNAFVKLFGCYPAFWGGAGNTWSPEITDALKRLGVPAYAYALTALPDHAVHRFNGVFALPQALSVSEPSWMDDDRARSESERILDSLRTTDRPWTGIFVGHPTRFRYDEFWDLPYCGGVTPVRQEFRKQVQENEYNRGKANLASFLMRLKQEFKVIGVDELLNWEWGFRAPTETESRFFVSETEKNLRAASQWPIHRTTLDPTHIVAKTMALGSTLEVAEPGGR